VTLLHPLFDRMIFDRHVAKLRKLRFSRFPVLIWVRSVSVLTKEVQENTFRFYLLLPLT